MVPVIDLFAGPGGLSEGFEQFRIRGKPIFRCVLSVEKDRYAHRTLLLRAFFRQFAKPPADYYRYLRREITLERHYEAYPNQLKAAQKTALKRALGYRNRELIDGLIRRTLRGHRSEWVLIGGPPCQAYSLAGRVKIRGEDRVRFEKDRRHFLYKKHNPDDVLNGQANSALRLVPYFVFSEFQHEALELELLLIDDPSQSFDTSHVEILLEELQKISNRTQLIIASHEREKFEPALNKHFKKQDMQILGVDVFDPLKGPAIVYSN